jgi:hypothetical protein
MPAINPERLAEEIREIQKLVGDPQKLRSRIMDLFDFFSDRTRRSQSSLRLGHADKKFGIPHPVMQAVERGLIQSVSEHPEIRPAIISEFWQVDYREIRLLAIALLIESTLEEVLAFSEIWSLETKDMELLSKLAQMLVSSWRKRRYSKFSQTTSSWLKGNNSRRSIFALLTFQTAVKHEGFSELPMIFQLLQTHDVPGNSKLQRSFHSLLQVLIERSEAETARFLLDLAEKDASTGRKIVRAVIDSFSPDQQSRLKHVLST